jgi:hypothetical protein
MAQFVSRDGKHPRLHYPIIPEATNAAVSSSNEIAIPKRYRTSHIEVVPVPGQFGGLAKVDSGFDYGANFSSFACVA